MTDITATMIAIIILYSTSHWIGASVLVVWLALLYWQASRSPTEQAFDMLRSLRG